MKNNAKVLFGLMIICIPFGCKSYLYKKYKFNRQLNFTTKQDYFNAVAKENGVTESNFLYVNQIGFNQFAKEFFKGPMTIYIGSFLNDSIALKKSDFLKENESCKGRMEEEIKKNILVSDLERATVDTTIRLKDFEFYTVKGDNKVSLGNSSKKIKIVLIYAYAMGTYYNDLYKEIAAVHKKYITNTDLFIISADPIFRLK